MARSRCFSGFSVLFSIKKFKQSSKAVKKASGNGDLRVNPEEVVEQSVHNAAEEASAKEVVLPMIQEEICAENDLQAPEVAYEGGDEHDDILSMKRDFSDFDLQALAVEKDEVDNAGGSDEELNIDDLENKLAIGEGITPEASIPNGHVSDPGISRTSMLRESPILKRSCSNIETRRATKLIWYTTKSNSSDDLPSKWEALDGGAAYDVPGSPSSVLSSFSADRAKSKKGSPCLVLPSRSTEFWCNRVILSHRNNNTPWILMPQEFSGDDTFKNNSANGSEKLESSPCFDTKNKPTMEQSEIDSKDIWVAFSAEYSTMDRVHAWVDSIEDGLFCTINNNDSPVVASYEVGETSRKGETRTGRSTTNEMMQARSNILQSAFSFPPAVHAACRGSKVMPPISAFGNLRTLNLSGNSIADVSLRFLPKNLHTLDLSKNKITTLEGLRELTRLRILNLSYNRISRIGHGVSNCILIRELYLAGNKISNVEGLHRLLKLTVLDLSFNKITTFQALGQLVANYKSLLALGLHGNPIGINMGDEPLRKSICSLLPGLAYLNKRPIKPQRRGREAAVDNTAKAALSSNDWTSRRRVVVTRRMNQVAIISTTRAREGTSRRRAGGAARRNNMRPSKYGRASRN